ncbi:MAG: hypothetical protein KC978_22120, partial [Candidatus Omnitrophica bacterium]|nr:hypothetical protein [Candidatus Omnitrophota bacterium]
MRKLALLIIIVLLIPSMAIAKADVNAVKGELIQILTELTQPASKNPDEGKAWKLVLDGEVMGKAGNIAVAWDGKGRHAISAKVKGMPSVQAAFGETESWVYLPEKNKVFVASHDKFEGPTLLTECNSWTALGPWIQGLPGVLMFLPVPDDVTVDMTDEDGILIQKDEDIDLRIQRSEDGTVDIVSESKKYAGRLSFKDWKQVPVDSFEKLLQLPDAKEKESVDIADMRAMFNTMIDYGSEALLTQFNKKMVPDPLAGVRKEQGVGVVLLKGTPEEMGKQHGTLLKDAIHYNMHRTLHGVGFLYTVESGDWFPKKMLETWKAQEKYVPERYKQEIMAMADASGISRDWALSTNVFPELFHCSGLAMCGKATEGGVLYHGRVLDYMTQVGLQNTAVVKVFQPEGRNAWADIGYAGMCSTVTAMNEKGLAMGEMGGRGEGYTDGIPMSIMMREIMERFETTQEALDWMAKTPRTCEYFYVLSDAKTKRMAGVASYAAELAK